MALIQPIVDGKIPENKTEDNASKGNELGYDQFLQLLCAEMQYQDPLEPTSNTEYVAQLATFSQMEAMLNMQQSIQSSNANGLVGKYVIVKSTNQSGNTTAEAGFVDYVQYEGSKMYVFVNGNKYSLADIYQVADTDYMEALTLAETFRNAVAALPDPDQLTAADEEAVAKLGAAYSSLTAYQKSMIDSDTLEKFKALVERMNEIVGDKKDEDKNDGNDQTGGTTGTGGNDQTGGTTGAGTSTDGAGKS